MGENIKDILQSSYLNPSEAKTKLEDMGYQYDTELSSPESKVFYDPKTNKANITFRGSKRVEDWLIHDPALALGIPTRRTRQANELLKKVEEKYKTPVDLFGHSLGGHLAEEAGGNLKSGNITTFNKGVGIKGLFKKIKSNQTDYRTSKDLVSALNLTQRGGRTKTIKSGMFDNIYNAHMLSAFKP